VAVVFMLLAGISFLLYFMVWRAALAAPLWRNPRCAPSWLVLAGSVVLMSVYLLWHGTYDEPRGAAPHRLPRGLAGHHHRLCVADYAQWPLFAPLLMILLGCFATCAGSTGGGIKMMRMLLLLKQARRELVRIVHPAWSTRSRWGAGGAAQVMQA
jgi:trk system potassium uptake protein